MHNILFGRIVILPVAEHLTCNYRLLSLRTSKAPINSCNKGTERERMREKEKGREEEG